MIWRSEGAAVATAGWPACPGEPKRSANIKTNVEIVVPAKAGTHQAEAGAAEKWVLAFPTEQVRGLKAHGTTSCVLLDSNPGSFMENARRRLCCFYRTKPSTIPSDRCFRAARKSGWAFEEGADAFFRLFRPLI